MEGNSASQERKNDISGTDKISSSSKVIDELHQTEPHSHSKKRTKIEAKRRASYTLVAGLLSFSILVISSFIQYGKQTKNIWASAAMQWAHVEDSPQVSSSQSAGSGAERHGPQPPRIIPRDDLLNMLNDTILHNVGHLLNGRESILFDDSDPQLLDQIIAYINRMRGQPYVTSDASSYDRDKQNRQIHYIYRGVAGIGHRFLRMACAFHLGQMVGLHRIDLESQAANCNNNVQVLMYHMFGMDSLLIYPQVTKEQDEFYYQAEISADPALTHSPHLKMPFRVPPNITASPTSTAPTKMIRFRNEVAGTCITRDDGDKYRLLQNGFFGKLRSDFETYSQLLLVYAQRSRIEDFKREHGWNDHVVIGWHIRAGNGEQGDFVDKERVIKNLERWLSNSLDTFELVAKEHSGTVTTSTHASTKASTNTSNHDGTSAFGAPQTSKPVLLFVATDTESVMATLESILAQRYASPREQLIKLIRVPQKYLEEGKSITAFAQGRTLSRCLEDWDAMFIDMALLSQANFVVAGTFSSFTRSMPLSIVTHRAQQQKRQGITRQQSSSSSSLWKPFYFCTMGMTGEVLACYDSNAGLMVEMPSIMFGDRKAPQSKDYTLQKYPLLTSWEVLEGLFEGTTFLAHKFGRVPPGS